MKIIKTLISTSTILLSLGVIWLFIINLLNIPDYILPSPFQVLHIFQSQFILLVKNSLITLVESLLGLILGILISFIICIFMISCEFLTWWLLPIIVSSQSIPVFAIAPLFVIWFGYGITSKIAITVLMVFFPITSSFYDGLKKMPIAYDDLGTVLCANYFKLIWFIQIPSALPQLASGIRIAATYAPMGAVIGEWVGANQGLGYLILNSNSRMEIDAMFASLACLVTLAFLLYFIVDKSLSKLIYWNNNAC